MGFRDDIESIKSYLPTSPERQTFLFSATVSPAIRQVALSTLATGHRYINCVSDDDSGVHEHIPQYHTVVADPSQLFPTLLHLITHDQLTMGDKSKIIVFFSTTKSVQLFSDFIVRAGPAIFPTGRKTKVYEMHSKRDMDRRMAVSRNFRNDTSGAAILVTSDVSARGVDYPGVSRVIQMGVPQSNDMYIHRVGRTGRGSSKMGRGDLVISSWEMGFVKRQLRNVPLKPLTVSTLHEQTKELAMAQDTADAAPGKEPVYSRRLTEIEAFSRTISTDVDPATAYDTFMAQVGFYIGRIHELGLNRDEVVSGLQAWTQEVFGLTQAPIIPHEVKVRLGLLGNENRSFSRGMNSFGSRRVGSTQAPWMGRGSRSSIKSRSPSGSPYGQSSGGYGSSSDESGGSKSSSYGSGGSSYGQRSGGYGSSSYGSGGSSYGQRSGGYGSGGSSYGQRSGGSSYGQRSGGSSYGQRSGGSSYGQRSGGSSYGQRSGGSGSSSYGSRDSNSYTPRSSQYGSRDRPGYGGSGGSSGKSSSGSRYSSSTSGRGESYDDF
jgi:ATP-dependent RNA helicase MSS116, mitochondrial